MWWIPLPTKKPTPSEYQVILFMLGLALFGFGLVGVVCGLLATPDKAVLAYWAIRYGAGGVVLGVLCFIGLWVVRTYGD